MRAVLAIAVLVCGLAGSAEACTTRLPMGEAAVQATAQVDTVFHAVTLWQSSEGGRRTIRAWVHQGAAGVKSGAVVMIVDGDPCGMWHGPYQFGQSITVLGRRLEDGRVERVWGAQEALLPEPMWQFLHPGVARPKPGP